MEYYTVKIAGLERSLPVINLGPKFKIASFNLLGDAELTEKVATKLAQKIKLMEGELLVGPEAKVAPLLLSLARILGQPRYVICRKSIRGYMTSPIASRENPILVIDGPDAQLVKNRRVVLVDDVISTGRTIKVLGDLVESLGAKVVGFAAVFKQGRETEKQCPNLVYLSELPLFEG